MNRNAIQESATMRENRYPVPTCLTALSREAFHNEHARKQKKKVSCKGESEREKRKLIDLTDENEGEGEGEIAKVARAHTSGKRKER